MAIFLLALHANMWVKIRYNLAESWAKTEWVLFIVTQCIKHSENANHRATSGDQRWSSSCTDSALL